MKCDDIRSQFPDGWAGTLDAGSKSEFESHLAACEFCRREWESLSSLWAGMAQLPSPEPGPGLRPRFYAMLAGYQQGLQQASISSGFSNWFGALVFRRPVLQFGLAASLAVAGFVAGYSLRTSGYSHKELAGLREEVHEMRRMVSLSLLKQQSASERLMGVSWSNQINHPDPEFLDALISTLNHDPSVDVRLAAVDALARFTAEGTVRQALIRSLAAQKSPLVQIALIDLLVQLHERRSIETLQQITNDTDQNQDVRQRAQWGLQLLG
jgi:hypothetical protein